MDIVKIAELTEKMCRKCNYMTPADIAIMMECAWETERNEKNKKTIEETVLKFKECFERKKEICAKREGVCIFVETNKMTDKDKNDIELGIRQGVKKADSEIKKLCFFEDSHTELRLTIALLNCGYAGRTKSKTIAPTENLKEKITELVLELLGDICCGMCIPFIVGIGIADNEEKANKLSEYAAFVRNAGSFSDDLFYSDLEKRLLRLLNRPKTGFMCTGGHNSVLSVNIEKEKSESEKLICAVTVTCYAIGRQKTEILSNNLT